MSRSDFSPLVRRKVARRAVVHSSLVLLVMGASAAATQAYDGPLFAVPCHSFGTGTNPRSAAIGDLNGDGKSDLATANDWSSKVLVLLGSCARPRPRLGDPGVVADGHVRSLA